MDGFTPPPELQYIQYHSSKERTYLSAIRQLISKDLSEPYSIYVYRYFLYQWGDLCFMVWFPILTSTHRLLQDRVYSRDQALDEKDALIGVVISKLEPHRGGPMRGYIAMLAVREEYRGRGVATKLVRMAVDVMVERDADEVCLLYSVITNEDLGDGITRLLWRPKSLTQLP